MAEKSTMIHTDVEEVQRISSKGLLIQKGIWAGLGWGLSVVVLLGFSPQLFHFQEYFFFPLLGVAVLVHYWRHRSVWIANPIMVPFLCFVGWIALTIPFSIDPWTSLKEWQKVVAQLAVFYGTCLIGSAQRDQQLKEKIMGAILIGASLCYTYALIDFGERGGNIWDRDIRAGYPKPEGADFTWLSTNVLMVLPMVGVGLLIWQPIWKRIIFGGAALLAWLGMVFSYSRGVWLGFLLQAALTGWIFNKKWMFRIMAGILVMMVVTVLLLGSGGLHRDTLDPWTAKARWAVWNMALADILAHPVTGVGYGVPIFEQQHLDHILQLEAMETDIPDIPEKPHNWYLMIAMGGGLPGIALFIWLLGRIWQTLWNGIRQAVTPDQRYWFLGTLLMATGFYVRIFFDDSFGGSHSYLFWILAGMAVAQIQQEGMRKSGR
jgi:putative inorganic carbon (hco3(-)) transporter